MVTEAFEILKVAGELGKTIEVPFGSGLYGDDIFIEQRRLPILNHQAYLRRHRSSAELIFDEELQAIDLTLKNAEVVIADHYTRERFAEFVQRQSNTQYFSRSSNFLTRGRGLNATYTRKPVGPGTKPVNFIDRCDVNVYDLTRITDLADLSFLKNPGILEVSWFRRCYPYEHERKGATDSYTIMTSDVIEVPGHGYGYSLDLEGTNTLTFGARHSYRDMAKIFVKKVLEVADRPVDI